MAVKYFRNDAGEYITVDGEYMRGETCCCTICNFPGEPPAQLQTFSCNTWDNITTERGTYAEWQADSLNATQINDKINPLNTTEICQVFWDIIVNDTNTRFAIVVYVYTDGTILSYGYSWNQFLGGTNKWSEDDAFTWPTTPDWDDIKAGITLSCGTLQEYP